MKIIKCLWKDQFVAKLAWKHAVATDEVEQVFRANGHYREEHVYRALGQTDAGRYLAVFFVYKHDGQALPISAREMDSKERRRYGQK